MKFYNPKLRRFFDRWPGKKTFGLYRFLPAFFVLGAALEFSMINWRVGEVNFCKFYQFPHRLFNKNLYFFKDNTFKKRQALDILEKRQYQPKE